MVIVSEWKKPRLQFPSFHAVPNHIAFIMDGNRRFAQMKKKESSWGHKMGVKNMENILQWVYMAKIRQITVYAFSTENFKRDKSEVEGIFELLEKALTKVSNDKRIFQKDIKIRMIGDTSYLSEKMLRTFQELEQKTAKNEKLCLNVAVAYGGRQEIAHALSKTAADILDGKNNANNESAENNSDGIEPAEISKHLFTSSDESVSNVDFLVRTGNEYRTSNFLPWQANGSNAVVCFHEKYWPDFGFKDFVSALYKYQKAVDERKDAEKKRLKKIETFLDAQKE
jgi:tritrans,polycis-undecaprenyl-diphosphate synthase [geranylgeranyl-diphosphate specific]